MKLHFLLMLAICILSTKTVAQSSNCRLWDLPFNQSAIGYFSGAFQYPVPKGVLELGVEVTRKSIAKKLADGCRHCNPCGEDEIHFYYRKWRAPFIEIRPKFDIYKGNLSELYTKNVSMKIATK